MPVSQPDESTVALVACNSYEETETLRAVERGIELLGGARRFASGGEKILLKPNVLYGAAPDRAVGTHPSIFKAVAKILADEGAILSYGDSPGFGSPASQFRKTRLDDAAKELGIRFADFVSGKEVSFPKSQFIRQFTIASGALEADGIVSLPKMKTHNYLKMTGAVKNQFGCVPGLLKSQFHLSLQNPMDFARMLVTLNLFLAPKLYVMDAVIAMEGNGPGAGDPVPMNALLLSRDPVALDSVMCRLCNLDPLLVPTNPAGKEHGLGNCDPEKIRITGDPIEGFINRNFKVDRVHRCGTRDLGPFTKIKSSFMPRPVINHDRCAKCGICISVCPVEPKVLRYPKGKKRMPPEYDYARCIRCYCCQESCPERAISVITPFLARLAMPKKSS
jgi:uncharacterized protein (DUF362 family)/Pyruvate/2-oxoacid:ferredoxin oxidoreductase delta subunit